MSLNEVRWISARRKENLATAAPGASAVDERLHRRRPAAGVPLLELGDPPVGALDHLAAAVGRAVAAQEPRRVADAQRVVDDQLLVRRDVAQRDQRVAGPAEVGVAGVVDGAPARGPVRSGRSTSVPAGMAAAANSPRPAMVEGRTSSSGTAPSCLSLTWCERHPGLRSTDLRRLSATSAGVLAAS